MQFDFGVITDNIISIAIEKSKKRMPYCLNYSGTRFLSLKIKITQFPDGFCCNTAD